MLSVIRKLLDLLSPRSRLQLGLLMGFLIVTAVVEAASVASLMPFIALVMSPETIHQNQRLAAVYSQLGFRSDAGFLTAAGLAVLAVLLAANVLRAISNWATMRYQYRELYQLRRFLLASYMAKPYSFFLARNSSELSSAIVNETSGVIDSLLRPLIDVAAGSLVAISIMVFLVIVDPVAALVIITVLAGSYVIIYQLVKRKLAVLGDEQVKDAAVMFRSVYEAMTGIKDVKVLGREATFLDRFLTAARSLSRNFAYLNIASQLPRQFLEVIAFGGVLIVILFYINQGREAANVIPVVGMYAFAGYRLLPSFHMMFGAAARIRSNVAKLHLVHEEIKAGKLGAIDPEITLRSHPLATAAQFRQSLELRDIVFRYDGARQPSLNGLNLHIPVGSSVGLVGPTGCGKSTTVDVILGLLRPASGQILLDGREITEEHRAGWQRIIGYVPQSIFISDDTLGRNIAFGIPDGEIDMDRVRKAAATANLSGFIDSSLSNGYDTQIGERGMRLSGGQRQRIGIARALYHDPSVLVMDEATSALDGVTEESVMDAVHQLAGKKTIIMIAHRLTTVRTCDVIYQLDGGVVVASGSYDDLMRDSSWFRSAARGAA
jgi:ABC-type multidrug transport system fused ATPase/permease subunit